MERKTRLTVSVCVQEKVTKCHVFRQVLKKFESLELANRGSDSKTQVLHWREDSHGNKKELQMELFFMERKTRLTVSVCVQEKVTKCHVFRQVLKKFESLELANRGSDSKTQVLHWREDSHGNKKELQMELFFMERKTRLELATVCLEGRYSTN